VGAVAFGVAAGAIAQVVWLSALGMDGGRRAFTGIGAAGFLAGFVIMYLTGLICA
jgi:hypothetical protein